MPDITCSFTTPGGTTFTMRDAGSDTVRIGIESSSFPLKENSISLSSNGGLPVVNVQQAEGMHVTVAL